MTEMTSRERVRAALAGQPVDRPPASLWGHDFLREWTPEDLVANTLDAYRPYGWDFIKFNPRATYFAEAWGSEYTAPSEQRQPRPVRHAVESIEALRGLHPVAAGQGVFGEHLHALRLLLEAVRADNVDVLHTVFSPLSVAATLAGDPARFREWAETDADAAHSAIRAVTETLAAYARMAVEAGASGIFFAPLTWASRDTASDEFYATFGRPYDLQVLEAVRAAPFNVLHVCRNNNMLLDLLDYPVGAFNWADRGAGNPSLVDARSRTDKPLMGGIDQSRVHTMSADEVAGQAQEAMKSVARGLFVTAGCAIPPETPPANREALARAVRG